MTKGNITAQAVSAARPVHLAHRSPLRHYQAMLAEAGRWPADVTS